MFRTRTLIGPLLVAAGLIVVGIHRVSASPAPTPTVPMTMTPVVQIDDAAKTWHVAGTIQMMNGQFWDVQGFVIQVTDTTKIDGDLPSIGTNVDAKGVVESDGTWLATSIVVGQTVPATPSTTPSTTATPQNTSTPFPTATATATATAPATATDTPLPTATVTTEDIGSGPEGTSSLQPIRLPNAPRPGITIIRSLFPEKNPSAIDKQKHPHPAHPPRPPANQHDSGSGHGNGHGRSD